MKQFTKKYQVWGYNDGNYAFTEFDTLDECIAADKYSSTWYITKRVSLSVKDADETMPIINPIKNTYVRVDEPKEDISPAAAAYLGGRGIGKLTTE